MLVTNCGRAFSFASALRQSYDVPQYFDERLQLLELHALRKVVDRLALGPSRRLDAPAQVIERSLRICTLKGRMERSSAAARRLGDAWAATELSAIGNGHGLAVVGGGKTTRPKRKRGRRGGKKAARRRP